MGVIFIVDIGYNALKLASVNLIEQSFKFENIAVSVNVILYVRSLYLSLSLDTYWPIILQ
jgi:hypothetical protein